MRALAQAPAVIRRSIRRGAGLTLLWKPTFVAVLRLQFEVRVASHQRPQLATHARARVVSGRAALKQLQAPSTFPSSPPLLPPPPPKPSCLHVCALTRALVLSLSVVLFLVRESSHGRSDAHTAPLSFSVCRFSHLTLSCVFYLTPRHFAYIYIYIPVRPPAHAVHVLLTAVNNITKAWAQTLIRAWPHARVCVVRGPRKQEAPWTLHFGNRAGPESSRGDVHCTPRHTL